MCNGFINVLKPPGMSSHDVVSFIRRVYKLKRVGHAGTLDPAAAGVLPVALGKATRLIEYMVEDDKSYRTELQFGYSTDSGDDTGVITAYSSDFTPPSRNALITVLQEFLGHSKQKPPMHSAIKMNGVKLYDLARKGISVDIPERSILIRDLTVKHYENTTLVFDVDCSKGTYIRSLCLDIGKKVNIPSVMSFLVRTRVGVFHLENAFSLAEIQAAPQAALLSPDSALKKLSIITLLNDQSNDFLVGKKLHLHVDSEELLYRIYDSHGFFIGIGKYRPEEETLIPHKVFHNM